MWSTLADSDDEDMSLGVSDGDQYRTYAYVEARSRRLKKIACGVASAIVIVILLIVVIAVASSGSDETGNMTNPTRPPDSKSEVKRPDVSNLRLPDWVVPSAYRLDLQPDLNTFRLYGTVEIDLELSEITDEILLHGNGLNVTSALLRESGQQMDFDASDIAYFGGDQQYIKMRFPVLVSLLTQQRSSFVLRLSFEGILGEDMTGFYRSSYTDAEGKKRWLAATQFEAVGARRAFPCFDEPAFKATFDVALRVDTATYPTVLSNQREVSRKPSRPLQSDAPSDSLERVVFERTPKMSTYLVAFVVADFGYKRAPLLPTGEGKPNEEPPEPRVDIRIYSTHETVNQTRYAARVARDVLAIYEDFFGIEYPMTKLDLIAIPDFSAGAMENWGLITFRTTALLYDALHSTAANKERVAVVVAHEIAHQWFGNLVTMQWWDELWLNEGFATFCEYYAINEMNAAETSVEHDRGWLMWQEFAFDRDRALYLDSLENSHPIKQPAARPSEIESLFDSISYSKGGSLLRMLYKSAVMSSGNFQKGLRQYLEKHKYGNARSTDLWAELAAVSGQEDLSDRLNGWITKKGYPVISFEMAGPTSYTAVQQHYLETGAVNDSSTWWVPLNVQNDDAQTEITLAPGARRSASFDVSQAYFVANADRWGVYRVAYPPELMRPLLGHLQRNGIGVGVDKFNDTLAAEDRPMTPLDFAGLVNDLLSFSASGFNAVTAADVIEVASYVRTTHNHLCWDEAIGALETVAGRFEAAGSPLADRVRELTKTLLKPMVLKWLDMSDGLDELIDDSDHDQQLLREMLFPLAIRREIPEALTAAKECWKVASGGGSCGSTKHPGLVPPPIQSAVFQWAARNNASAFEDLLQRYTETRFPGERSRLQSALTAVQDSTARDKLLQLALTTKGAVRKQDQRSVVVRIAAQNSAARDVVWAWLKTNFEKLSDHSDGLFGGVSTMIAGVVRRLGTRAQVDEAKQFIEKHKSMGLDGRDVQQALEAAEHTISWVAANTQPVTAWLDKQNQ